MAKTKKCFKCGQIFRREELIDYARAGATTLHSFCPTCLELEQIKERFDNEVCKIFGIKKPGTQINTERKRLIDTYGYTDQTILDCLHYVYDVKKIPPKKATLYFVTPTMVDEMMKYKRTLATEGRSLAQAMQSSSFTEYVVPVREATPRQKQLLNPDDYFDD